jgi:hypothetical protein
MRLFVLIALLMFWAAFVIVVVRGPFWLALVCAGLCVGFAGAAMRRGRR